MKIYMAHFKTGYTRHTVTATTEDFETAAEFKAWIKTTDYEDRHGNLITIEEQEAR